MEKYDSALLGILQNEGKVAPFLDVILGFLYRRTDFFHIMKTENEKLGFPPGVAKKLLVNIFTKYEMLAQRDAARVLEMKKAREAKSEKANEQTNFQTEPVQSSEGKEDKNSTQHEDDLLEASQAQDSLAVKNPAEDERGKEEAKDLVEEDNATTMEVDSSQRLTTDDDQDKGASKDNDGEEKEDPEQVRQRRLLQENPLTYNGAERENYLWSQNISEVDVRVKIPKHIVKGKQVRVDLAKKHIRVSHQGDDGAWCTVMDNDLMWEIRAEESMWTLTSGEFVHINMEKKEERWWECVFVDEPKINTRKIDCSRPMTDLDDEAQAKIEEMMYNQRQKQLGLPQSHEQKTHEMLRKAWDAEGSPFKGQPFDPSRFNVDSNGVVNMNQP